MMNGKEKKRYRRARKNCFRIQSATGAKVNDNKNMEVMVRERIRIKRERTT